jgi:DeoR family suf operon transcriptional repressor
MLTSLGYMAEADETAGTSQTLKEHNCAIRMVAERYPEVCEAEEQFIQAVLGAEVTRQTHITKGANCCEYCITQTAATVPAEQVEPLTLVRATHDDTTREARQEMT